MYINPNTVIDNPIANISLYVLSRPKLKFRYSLTFEIIFLALIPENFYFMQIVRFDRKYLLLVGVQQFKNFIF